jgi:hypothetical protein
MTSKANPRVVATTAGVNVGPAKIERAEHTAGTFRRQAIATDLESEPISFAIVRDLVNHGFPRDRVGELAPLRTVRSHIAFYEPADDDLIFWHPESGAVSRWRQRAFALGGSELCASSGALAPLRLHADPLAWLCAGDGLYVTDWTQAFDRLRDVPQVAVAEAVLPLYREHMRPPHLPRLSVLVTAGEPERLAA